MWWGLFLAKYNSAAFEWLAFGACTRFGDLRFLYSSSLVSCSDFGSPGKHIFSTFPKFILRWWELLSLLFHWSYVATSDKNCKIFVTVTKTKFSSLGLPFDIKVCQKHVKMPQILQNANRYSNRSSRQNELICLKGFSGKWKMTFWQPNKSKTCQNASNFAKRK